MKIKQYTNEEILDIIAANISLDKNNTFTTTIFHDIMENVEDSRISGYNAGATKAVIFLRNADFVVKIPFTGDDDNEYDEYIAFSGAVDGGEGWDYCKAEEIIFNNAVDEGVSQFLLETKCIGNVNGYPIYVQPICKEYVNSSYPSPSKDEYTKSYEELCNNDIYIGDLNSAFAFYVYCEVISGDRTYDELRRFERFAEDEIFDIHNHNIGFRNNHMVILDYSGFNEYYGCNL